MALPTMTAEQRNAALAKAAAVRKARSELIEEVRKGKISLSKVLERADKEDLVKKTKVAAVIRRCPASAP